MSDDADLPKALVKKIAKSKLAAIDQENGVEVKDVQISKDALLALSESARVFIHYLTATGEKIRLPLWHTWDIIPIELGTWDSWSVKTLQ